MPFSDEQKKQHIAELQQYLHAVSLIQGNIPLIMPDGVYGRETSAAVKAFQHQYDLPETGDTDSDTWDKVVEVYKKSAVINPKCVYMFPSSEYVCMKGSHGDVVYTVQVLLAEICKKYDNFPNTEISGDFTENTERAVTMIQKLSGLSQNGKVNMATWNMIVRISGKNN